MHIVIMRLRRFFLEKLNGVSKEEYKNLVDFYKRMDVTALEEAQKKRDLIEMLRLSESNKAKKIANLQLKIASLESEASQNRREAAEAKDKLTYAHEVATTQKQRNIQRQDKFRKALFGFTDLKTHIQSLQEQGVISDEAHSEIKNKIAEVRDKCLR